MKRVEIYDTTLRDGTQAEDFNLSVADKVKIAIELDKFGIDYIEGGWPGAVPGVFEFFKEMGNYDLRNSLLAAFGSTRLFKNSAADDVNLNNLLQAEVPVITIFGKSWDFHVETALQIGLEDNLTIIQDSLGYLRPNVDKLFYDAEHFFDGYKANKEYALKTLDAAVSGGADCLVLCDSNGGNLPFDIVEIIQDVKKGFPDVQLGIHAHNDSATAVASSLYAVKEGVVQVQGTINGKGERSGNADLISVIPDLHFKMGFGCEAGKNLENLTQLSRLVTEVANLAHDRHQPFVGYSSFAHKGGIHASAVKKNPSTYEHINPEMVGNTRRIIISEQSGKANVLHKAKKFGLDLGTNDLLVRSLVKKLKQLEKDGFQFEAAEASFEILIREAMGLQRRYFTMQSFRAIDSKRQSDECSMSEATVKIDVGCVVEHTAASGEGPVNALDKALRRSLIRFYPQLNEVVLNDYKVRVLNVGSDKGTSSKVRVLIESSDGVDSWGTVGVSKNLVEASWKALVDSFTYKLLKDEKKRLAQK